ncbi:hypothetical protein ACFQ1Q_10695 [Winogradskyella litorisediminis]|uniref:Heme oxygenase n=1 Tax=Winogradskyella litorisediminis TaxID=1156618 RepID=A0ABW3N9T4_9FLAO
MLYIKFNILDTSKFADFQKLYDHMVKVRQPNFEFEDETLPDFDWENMDEAQMQEAFDMMHDSCDTDAQALKRYAKIIPKYANKFITEFIAADAEIAGAFGYKTSDIINYLEASFEVDFTNIDTTSDNQGIIKFTTGNYPFGGLERFFMVLKAFDLEATECFNGFSVLEIIWLDSFQYTTVEKEEETKIYLQK